MSNSQPSLIPHTWNSPHLQEVSQVRYGLGQPPHQAADGVPMIRATNVKRGKISEEGLIRIKQSAIPVSRNPYLKTGDVIVVRSGAYTGDVAMITEKWAGSVAGYDLVVSPGELLDSAFCAYALLSSPVQRHFKGLSNRAAQAHLNRQQLQTTPIPLPPLPEQKKIAHILSTVQRAIEVQERIIQTATELKKSLMHKLFTEGLRNEPHKQSEIGPVPVSWEVVAFDKFVTLQRGYDLRKQDFRNGSVPVIGATQVIGFHDRANVKAPGVTVVRSGSSAGKPQFIAEDFWAHNVLLYVKDFHGNIPKFVYYKIIALDLTQYRQGVAVPTLNRNTFSGIEIALPSKQEQREITDALDAVGKRTEVAERKKTQLQELFRTLLHELMTAKTRVHHLEFSRSSTATNP